MKKIILLVFIVLTMVNCTRETDKLTRMDRFEVHQIDSCEYLKVEGYYGILHKGNCRFCKERRRKELEKLVEQLKK